MSEHNHEELTFLDDFESEHPKPSHQYGIYKGLGCLAGMYVFFLIEKCVQMKQVDKPGLDTKKLDKIMKNEYVGILIFILNLVIILYLMQYLRTMKALTCNC